MTSTAQIPAGVSLSVKVPATTANLGPGFDTLGLALSLYDELQVVVRDDNAIRVTVHGEGEGIVHTDESNLVAQSVAHVFSRYDIPLPGLDIVANNAIPQGKGLGSSGAAIVAGVMVAKGLLEGIVSLDATRMLELATELEGHPDNVAPSLFGGLTIAWVADDGPKYKKLFAHRGVSTVVFVPEKAVSTALARSLQPTSVPHKDAIFNVSRSALLIASLIQSPELLLAATEDRLHQSYRASAMRETDDLIQMLRQNGLAAVVSGAGPSVLVLCSDPGQRLLAAELVSENSVSTWTPLMLAVDLKGATVMVHPVEGSD